MAARLQTAAATPYTAATTASAASARSTQHILTTRCPRSIRQRTPSPPCLPPAIQCQPLRLMTGLGQANPSSPRTVTAAALRWPCRVLRVFRVARRRCAVTAFSVGLGRAVVASVLVKRRNAHPATMKRKRKSEPTLCAKVGVDHAVVVTEPSHRAPRRHPSAFTSSFRLCPGPSRSVRRFHRRLRSLGPAHSLLCPPQPPSRESVAASLSSRCSGAAAAG